MNTFKTGFVRPHVTEPSLIKSSAYKKQTFHPGRLLIFGGCTYKLRHILRFSLNYVNHNIDILHEVYLRLNELAALR